VNRVVGADQEIGADSRQLVRGGEHQLTDARPVVVVDASHIVGQRVRVHRDLWVSVQAEERRAFRADCPIAKRRTFCGAGDDADVAGHDESSKRAAIARILAWYDLNASARPLAPQPCATLNGGLVERILLVRSAKASAERQRSPLKPSLG
jgi:hypothetical protein